MNPINDLVVDNVSNTGTVTSAAIQAKFILGATAQAFFSDGAAAGTLKLQGSNDPGTTAAPSHWNDIPLATAAVVAGATTMTPILATYFSYQWIRVSFASSGGAGTLSVNLHAWGG